MFFLAFIQISSIIKNENHFQIERDEFMTYNTKQKDTILEVIQKQRKEFAIKDIYHELNGKVGLTTIYRLVDKLEKEGHLKKINHQDDTFYYQYLEECNEENHFYLKCDKCGNLIHIDCDCINDLYEHISHKHNFKLNKENIIINGLCSKCTKGGK